MRDFLSTHPKRVLYMNDYSIQARRYLKLLRDGTNLYDNILDRLHRELKSGKLTFKDIDTSDDEIKKLRILGCKLAAIRWLQALRRGVHVNVSVSYIYYMYHELEVGELSLEDIGTTDTEVQLFKQKRCVATS